MRPLHEIPPVIQGPYQHIKFEYLTKLNKLSKAELRDDVIINGLKVKMISKTTQCFEQSVSDLLNKMKNKKSSDSLQAIYDHFTMWNDLLQAFKKNLMSEIELRAARKSSGSATMHMFSQYEKNLAQLDFLVHQVKSLIVILETTINKNLPLSYEQFKKKLSEIMNEKEYRSLYKALIHHATRLKVLPLLEVEPNYSLDQYDVSDYENDQSDNDTSEPASERRMSDSDSSTNSNDSDTESSLHMSQEIPAINSSSNEINKSAWKPANPSIHTNRQESANIQDILNELTKRIASTNPNNKVVINHLKNRVSKLANTDELKQYCTQREKYWSMYFSNKIDNPLITPIHKPPSDK